MTLAQYYEHTCTDHSHSHLTKAEVYELQSHDSIEWLKGNIRATVKDKGVLKISRYFPARGLSCSVGGELAEMLASEQRRGIGNVMFAHIKMRSEEQRAQCTAS